MSEQALGGSGKLYLKTDLKMAFTLKKFTHTGSSKIKVDKYCSASDCKKGAGIDLEVEVIGKTAVDVVYKIEEGESKYCRGGGTTKITKSGVKPPITPETVYFCRETKGLTTIKVKATVSNSEGQPEAKSLPIYFTVKPNDTGALKSHALTQKATGFTNQNSFELALELPTASKKSDVILKMSLSKKSDVWFVEGGKLTKKLIRNGAIGRTAKTIKFQVALTRSKGKSKDKSVWVTASIYLATGQYLSQRRCLIET